MGLTEEELRFVTDRMLGKLSVWLRVLGHDTVYVADLKAMGAAAEDKALAAFAKEESRILLTRDKDLVTLARKKGVQCLYIQADDVMTQLKELLRYNLDINLEPVPQRCSVCNARIRRVTNEEWDMLMGNSYVPTSEVGKREFWVCVRCGKIYWAGSHWRNMRERLRQLQ
ncbi:MAG: DUF5615 family PIN-like protein [Halobacteriota archaeon]